MASKTVATFAAPALAAMAVGVAPAGGRIGIVVNNKPPAAPSNATPRAKPAKTPAPTTAPAPSARELERRRAFTSGAAAMLNNLTSGRYSKRHAAMKFFTGSGRVAVPFLKTQLKSARSPQLRGMLSRALQSIHMHYVLGATLITIHLHNASTQQALDVLSKQTGVKFMFWPPQQVPGAVKINLNATRQPFWVVMGRLQQQTGVGCAQWGYNNADNTFTLQTGQTTVPPEYLHGPFMAQAINISRNAYVQLVGSGKQPPPTRSVSMQLMLYSEPKIVMLNIGGLTVDQAISDTGKSLLPPANGNASYWGGNSGHVVNGNVQLVPGNHPGKYIAKFRGHWNELVATRMARWTVNNPAAAKKSTRVLPDGTTVTFDGIKKVGQTYTGTIELSNPANPIIAAPNMPGMAGQSLINVQGNFMSSDVRLLDAHGSPFSTTQTGSNSAGATFTYNVTWSRLAQWGNNAPVGQPTRLVVTLPVEFQNVSVPVKFNHLRLP